MWVLDGLEVKHVSGWHDEDGLALYWWNDDQGNLKNSHHFHEKERDAIYAMLRRCSQAIDHFAGRLWTMDQEDDEDTG